MSGTSDLVTSQADPEPEPSSVAINEPVEQPVEKCSTTNIYRPPTWASVCPTSAGYYLEVIKNGIPLPDCTVHLSGADQLETGMELSFCLIGRQPQQYYAPYNDLHGQCSVLAHPSISRLHAVLQYGRPPSVIAKTSATQVDSPGWYIQDLDSTHGTYINKRRLPPGRFVRIHVGYVMRFGGSTRLHLLHGPDDDVEKESNQSWTELKQAHLARQLTVKDVRSNTNSLSSNVDLGCDWGLSAEDADVNTPSFLAAINGAACLSHENLYQDDPKRALKVYFEREGIEPAPEYEFVEAAFGKQHCKIELPLSSGTVTAEAVVTGKRKEAIAACALEACRLLDRLGEFDPNKDNSNSGKRVRSKAYWEENDYYSSDEDTFIDRTGQVERKRLGRIRQLGVQGPDADEAEKQAAEFTRNSQSLVSKRLDSASLMTVLTKLEEVGEQIVSLEDKLEEIDKAFAPQMANPSELDELEAYMNALKSGAPTQKERMKLKSQLFTLRQAEMRLFQQAGLSQLRRHAAALTQNDESGLDRSSSNGRIHRTDAAAAVRAAKRRLENGPEAGILAATENRPTNTRLKIDEIKRSLQSHSKAQKTNDAPSLDEPFEVEEDDNEDEDAHQNKLSDAPSPSVKINTPRTTDPKQPQSPPVQALIRVHTGTESIVWSSDSTKSAVQKVHIAERPLPLMDQQLDAPGPDSVCSSNHTAREPTEECKPRSKNSECAHNGSTQNEDVVNSKRSRMSRPQLPAEPMDVFHQADPDYVTWIPPPDQQGDGITALNAKFGY